MQTNITKLNKDFLFVFTPNPDSGQFALNLFQTRNDKRFLIGAGKISHYITQKNANKVISATQKMKTDKKTIKFRNYGKIEIYVK